MEVTHILETMLDRVRKGEAPLTDDMVDASLVAGDVLKNLLAAHRGEDEADLAAAEAICHRLEALCLALDGGNVAAPAPAPAPAFAAEAPGGSEGGFEVHFRISGDQAAAAEKLRKALEITPNLLQAQQGLASLAMAANKPDEALAIARTVQKQRPKEAAGYILEGEIQAAGKAWDKTIDAYRAGLKQVDNPELAVRLHSALQSAGKKADADRWAADWTRSHPKDASFPFYLGSQALSRNELPESLRQFERTLTLQPDNAIALNNRAWIKGQLGKEGALADAERANTLAPNQPPLMDTWAMLLSAANQHDKAVELQKKVVQLQPQQLGYKLNLAKIYLKAGRKDAARPLVDELSAAGDKFPGQAEVAELKKAL